MYLTILLCSGHGIGGELCDPANGPGKLSSPAERKRQADSCIALLPCPQSGVWPPSYLCQLVICQRNPTGRLLLSLKMLGEISITIRSRLRGWSCPETTSVVVFSPLGLDLSGCSFYSVHLSIFLPGPLIKQLGLYILIFSNYFTRFYC